MTHIKSDTGWAAAWVEHDDPFVMAHTTRNTRAAVIEHMGNAWARDGQTWRQGWKRAYREGCRAVRVRVFVQ